MAAAAAEDADVAERWTSAWTELRLVPAVVIGRWWNTKHFKLASVDRNCGADHGHAQGDCV